VPAIYGRFRRWLRLEQEKGLGLAPLLLWHLPRQLWARSYAAAAGRLNDSLLFARNLSKLQDFLAGLPPAPPPRFYLIVMPGTLHFVLPCVRLVPAGVSLVLLLNGAAAAEADLLERRFPHRPAFRLAALPGSSLSHGGVLNLLFAAQDQDFGILDHDLYVFQPEIYQQLHLDDNCVAVGAFRLYNRKANLFFPTTHFLFFNIKLIKNIIKKYDIGAQIYNKPPPQLKTILSALQLTPDNYLKDYLNYFDTLNLIWALALHEGYTFRFFPLTYGEFIYHLGATSHGTKDLYQAYIQQKFLELPENHEVACLYGGRAPGAASSDALKHRLPPTDYTQRFLAETDRWLAKLAA